MKDYVMPSASNYPLHDMRAGSVIHAPKETTYLVDLATQVAQLDARLSSIDLVLMELHSRLFGPTPAPAMRNEKTETSPLGDIYVLRERLQILSATVGRIEATVQEFRSL